MQLYTPSGHISYRGLFPQPAAGRLQETCARSAMRLTLVVPCFNEIDVIGRFHGAVSHELAATGESYEIIYVDDGSTDGTLEVLVEIATGDPSVRYLSFSR